MNNINKSFFSRLASQGLYPRQKTPGLKTWVNPIAAMLVLSLGVMGNVYAAEFTVNTAGFDGVDINPGNGSCSTGLGCTLRAAVMEANANGNPEETDIIYISSNISNINLTIIAAGSDGDNEGDLNITQDVQIISNRLYDTSIADVKDRLTTIDAQSLSRHFRISNTGTNVVLRGLRLTGGASGSDILGGSVRLFSGNTLTIDYCVLENNNASGNGDGGAVYVATGATFTLSNSDIANNSLAAMSTGNGAGIYNGGTTSISRSSIRGNYTAGKSQIHSTGTLTVTNSTISAVGDSNDAPVGITSLSTPLTLDGVTIAEHTLFGVNYTGVGFVDNFSLFRTAFNNNATDCNTNVGFFGESDYNWFEDAGQCGEGINGNNTGALTAVDIDPALSSRENLVSYFYDVPITSDLIDSGAFVASGCALLSDQRGEPRPFDGNNNGTLACDIGAVEFNTRLFADGFEDI